MKIFYLILFFVATLSVFSQTKTSGTKSPAGKKQETTSAKKPDVIKVAKAKPQVGIKNYFDKTEIPKDSLLAATEILAYTYQGGKIVYEVVESAEVTCSAGGAVYMDGLAGGKFSERTKKIFEKVVPGKNIFFDVTVATSDGAKYKLSCSYKITK